MPIGAVLHFNSMTDSPKEELPITAGYPGVPADRGVPARAGLPASTVRDLVPS